HRDAHRCQPAGREGGGRGGDDRRHAGDRERGDRCAGAIRRAPHRHAAQAGKKLAADAEGSPAMIPSAFDYAAPATLEEALSALKAGGEGSMPLSGGQSLIPILKLRLASPESLIDLARIPGLRRINADEDPISIGALTTHAMIEDSAALREVC